mgnify:CR=1 FL=1
MTTRTAGTQSSTSRSCRRRRDTRQRHAGQRPAGRRRRSAARPDVRRSARGSAAAQGARLPPRAASRRRRSGTSGFTNGGNGRSSLSAAAAAAARRRRRRRWWSGCSTRPRSRRPPAESRRICAPGQRSAVGRDAARGSDPGRRETRCPDRATVRPPSALVQQLDIARPSMAARSHSTCSENARGGKIRRDGKQLQKEGGNGDIAVCTISCVK